MSAAANGKKSSGNGKSRGRCSVYDDIDGLSDCLSLPEAKRLPTLVGLLQRILNQLAYYSTTGDGAVLEAQEEWHETFTDRLYTAAGQARQQATPPAAPGGPARAAAPPPPVPARKAPDDLPASLRAIMNGSHTSLKNDSDDDD